MSEKFDKKSAINRTLFGNYKWTEEKPQQPAWSEAGSIETSRALSQEGKGCLLVPIFVPLSVLSSVVTSVVAKLNNIFE